MKPSQIGIISLLALSAGILSCEKEDSEADNFATYEAKSNFVLINPDNVGAISDGAFSSQNLIMPASLTVSNNDRNDSAYFYTTIYYQSTSKSIEESNTISLEFRIPAMFLNTTNGSSWNSLKNPDILIGDELLTHYFVSYFIRSEEFNHQFSTDETLHDKSHLEIVKASFLKDSFGNRWFYLEGKFDAEMLEWAFYNFENKKKIHATNGHFSALYLVEGQTTIKPQ